LLSLLILTTPPGRIICKAPHPFFTRIPTSHSSSLLDTVLEPDHHQQTLEGVRFLSNALSQHSTSSSGFLPFADMSGLCSNSPRLACCSWRSRVGFVLHTGKTANFIEYVEREHTAQGDIKGSRGSWLHPETRRYHATASIHLSSICLRSLCDPGTTVR
jgi:hypothetical protein